MAYMNPKQPTSSSMQKDIHTAIEMDTTGKNGLRNRKHQNTNNSNNRPAGFPEEKMKRIDYVLVYDKKDMDELSDSKKKQALKKELELRDKFENELLDEGIEIQTDEINEVIYQKLHTPYYRLCQEAEKVKLEMPLIGCELYDDEEGCYEKLKTKYLVTDDEVDFVSAPFVMSKLEIYEGNDDPDTFFRPSLRCFLTHHIMINMDIRTKQQEEDDPLAKKGLPYLLHKKVYRDSFVLHDETMKDPALMEELDEYRRALGSQFMLNEDQLKNPPRLVLPDTRQDLNDTWARMRVFYKYQPLWKIRNYFGEKIGLYFAWSGTMISTLWIPMILGVCIFFYGLHLSVTRKLAQTVTAANATLVDEVAQAVTDSISIIKESFDNAATPYFALIVCLWGTIFLEVWKRKNATLAYEWDVDNWEDVEPDRPEFYGLEQKPDPIIPSELTWIYPVWRQILKFLTSFSVLIIMVICVFICAASVILYRVFMTVTFCTAGSSAVECLLVSTVVSSLLQAVSIMILGKLYDKLAVILTNWENHRTQTRYDDALIIKLFAFQFANSYTSLFYIAFFRRKDMFEQGLFNLGPEYVDNCGTDDNCMAMLSLQVAILMLAKPFPKFLKDIVLPFLKKLWRKRPCCRKKKVGDTITKDYLERERLKPQLGDFTLGEYTEKVIVYGFLMLFAGAFPLAPLIAMIVNAVDIRVDSKRMLWWYRRPVAYIAQDIGMWYGILQFLNIAGVVSNAFLIAFTSSWGRKYSDIEKLWIVIGFEHIVFTIKFLIDMLIPDVPPAINLSQKREKYQVARIMAEATNGNFQLNPKTPPPNSSKRPYKHDMQILEGNVEVDNGVIPPKAMYDDSEVPSKVPATHAADAVEGDMDPGSSQMD